MDTINIPLGNNILKRGDTIKEILFEFDVADNIDLTSATIRMQLYFKNSVVFSVDSTSGITIIDSKSFKIDESVYLESEIKKFKEK